MDPKAQDFYQKIRQALSEEKLVLPTLPEVALKIREEIEVGNCSANQLAEMLAQDGAMSAHFIKVANSPVYRGIEPIDDLQTIISRMGLAMVRDLVMSLSMKQIFMATSDELDKQFRNAWSTSVGVAAISRVLAVGAPGLAPEQALLSGLIHNIGILPILVMAEKEDNSFKDETDLQNMINSLQGHVGQLILDAWEFPEHLQDVVTDCHNLQRNHDGRADYADVVQVSLLQGGYIHNYDPENYAAVNAFNKLNLDPEVTAIQIEDKQEMIDETKSLLN